ncbi:Uncharacterized protein dnm_089270 [Desulfonema magnum]|uniref:Uncharacterized protein n=1 Tax=Desulfonema magnum TaxID=45655 RepID=A0A975GT92_9BACT|nr:Uncharacterized protein dnm_089270 [Desulfonema magnum]
MFLNSLSHQKRIKKSGFPNHRKSLAKPNHLPQTVMPKSCNEA